MNTTLIPSDLFLVTPCGARRNATFAKNSHRPNDEVQEVVYIKGSRRESKLKCEYIEIDELDAPVNSVFLSKPGWAWGAEIGSNNKNVVIGNIALKSCYNEGDADVTVKRLLGSDLVRLGLERGSTSKESLDVITGLLEKYGQGGSWTEFDSNAYFHNSFIITDNKESWILETCGKFWAANKITTPYNHFTNDYVITTKIDLMSEGLKDNVKDLGLWNGEGEFDFAKCFSLRERRAKTTQNELEKLAEVRSPHVTDIFRILRDMEHKICLVEGDYTTQSSFVSCLNSVTPCLHWFTGTPNPSISVFKPFIFTPNAKISRYTVSAPEDPKHQHQLFILHKEQNVGRCPNILSLLREMETECVHELADFMENYDASTTHYAELDELMKDCVETEVKFYR